MFDMANNSSLYMQSHGVIASSLSMRTGQHHEQVHKFTCFNLLISRQRELVRSLGRHPAYPTNA